MVTMETYGSWDIPMTDVGFYIQLYMYNETRFHLIKYMYLDYVKNVWKNKSSTLFSVDVWLRITYNNDYNVRSVGRTY